MQAEAADELKAFVEETAKGLVRYQNSPAKTEIEFRRRCCQKLSSTTKTETTQSHPIQHFGGQI